jgi:hypothetical protein
MAPPELRYLLTSVQRAQRPGIRQQLPRIDDVTDEQLELIIDVAGRASGDQMFALGDPDLDRLTDDELFKVAISGLSDEQLAVIFSRTPRCCPDDACRSSGYPTA